MDLSKGMLPVSPERAQAIAENQQRYEERVRQWEAAQEAERLYRGDNVEQGMESLKRLWRIIQGERPTRDAPSGMLPMAPPAPVQKPYVPFHKKQPEIIGVRG